MSRLQLALNVSDLDVAVDFDSKLFATTPSKLMPGYANFAIDEPPLKLVLIETADSRGTGIDGPLNRLGVEVFSTDVVETPTTRLAGEGLDTTVEESETCCFALQDKVWVHDPDGVQWEVYAVLAVAPAETGLYGDRRYCPPGASKLVQVGTKSSVCC